MNRRNTNRHIGPWSFCLGLLVGATGLLACDAEDEQWRTGPEQCECVVIPGSTDCEIPTHLLHECGGDGLCDITQNGDPDCTPDGHCNSHDSADPDCSPDGRCHTHFKDDPDCLPDGRCDPDVTADPDCVPESGQ